jgi:hypothetical protein
MADAKPMSTLISTMTAMDPNEDDEVVDQREYMSMIGSSCTSRRYGRTSSSPCACVHAFRLPHALRIVKQFSESSGISNKLLKFGVSYSASFSLDLVGFSDTDFAGSDIDRKSISGTCHFLESSLVCWSYRKPSSVAQSTTEAGYVATAPKSYLLRTP